MKKLLLVAAILVGAVSASHAGVNFSIGIGIPVPPPVIISHPAPVYCPPPAPVYCPPPAVIYEPPVVYAPRVYAPPVMIGRPCYQPRRYHYEEHWRDGHGNRGHYESHSRW